LVKCGLAKTTETAYLLPFKLQEGAEVIKYSKFNNNEEEIQKKNEIQKNPPNNFASSTPTPLVYPHLAFPNQMPTLPWANPYILPPSIPSIYTNPAYQLPHYPNQSYQNPTYIFPRYACPSYTNQTIQNAHNLQENLFSYNQNYDIFNVSSLRSSLEIKGINNLKYFYIG
jgi:hypothetical protein